MLSLVFCHRKEIQSAPQTAVGLVVIWQLFHFSGKGSGWTRLHHTSILWCSAFPENDVLKSFESFCLISLSFHSWHFFYTLYLWVRIKVRFSHKFDKRKCIFKILAIIIIPFEIYLPNISSTFPPKQIILFILSLKSESLECIDSINIYEMEKRK